MACEVRLWDFRWLVLCVWCVVSVHAAATNTNSLHLSGNPKLDTSGGCAQAEVCLLEVECRAGKSELTPCWTANNTRGVCCAVTDSDDKLLISAAIEDGRREFKEKLGHVEQHRDEMAAKEKPLSLFHKLLKPSAGQEANVIKTDPKERTEAYESVFASRKYAEAANMTKEDRQGGRFPRHLAATVSWPYYGEFSSTLCNPNARYRTYDGMCNNPVPERAAWGSAEYPFERLFTPAYEDGVWAPRSRSVTGNWLPSARTISTVLFPDVDRQDPQLNILFMQMGQFITHDIAQSQAVTLDGEKDIQCCASDGSQPLYGEKLHFACMPIDVSPNDPYYSQFGFRCMNFVRIKLACGPECYLGYASQANSVTHFIDASLVYGNSEAAAASLRTFQYGKLRSSHSTGIELLPFTRKPTDCVPWARVCFETGDFRANQLLAITQFQTMFLREHNRVAGGLNHINPHWDDERLFQEARRIVIAVLQNIVFNEYLPVLLGSEKVMQFGLLDPVEGYGNSYSPDIPPMTLTESAVAAFRFGHSTVDGFFRLLHRDAPAEDLHIKDLFFDPSKIHEPHSFDRMMYSFGQQSQQLADNSMSAGLTNHLFQKDNPFGFDLASLNIHRGRDFAVRPYNDYRVWAGLPRITDFYQLGEMGSLLAQVYESPEDIDLWVGGLYEAPSYGAVVGPTFSHLLAEMFYRLKRGDRYYFTNGPEVNPGAFTPWQLGELRAITLAGLICSNVDDRYDFYQAPSAFYKSSWDNEPVPCASYRPLDLEAWRE
nr:chorion peroxidase-like isoform X1 [Aedes albopictus]